MLSTMHHESSIDEITKKVMKPEIRDNDFL